MTRVGASASCWLRHGPLTGIPYRHGAEPTLDSSLWRYGTRHPLDERGANRAGSGGRLEGEWYALRDIVEVRGGHVGSRAATVTVLDKTASPLTIGVMSLV